jgi:anti-sigma B factor antagonist
MPVETKNTEQGIAVVSVSGRLVLGKDVERLETVVDEMVKAGQKTVVMDVSTLDYADSAGIGTIVACITQIKKAGGDMRMAGANARVMRLLQMTGVDQLLKMFPDVAAASQG